MTDRRTCPNCGARPLPDRYIPHVEACTGESIGVQWFWTQGWRDKLTVIGVTIVVLALSVAAKVVNRLEEQ